MTNLNWKKLLNDVRRKDLEAGKTSASAAGARTEIERDYDRILFSTPVRRLADKTQVFPLEKNDSVRTRLTHSHEVSNIARSIGTAICYDTAIFKKIENAERNVPSMLAAVGLAHDLGNPPFGHQGEFSIGDWFKKNQKAVFGTKRSITKQMRLDYIDFEGNAQALRILTRLQILNDHYGMNLTCGSLAALIKYPSSSDKVDKKNPARKKFGFFFSEKKVCQTVWKQTGLSEGIRHPLVYIMEASDDIAYSVLDAEDAVKKCLVSYNDLISYLETHGKLDPVIKNTIAKAQKKHEEHKGSNLSPSELNDVSMQLFRVYAIGNMVECAIESFKKNYSKIISGSFNGDLISKSKANELYKQLKDFSFKHAYKHRTVLELELRGHHIIHSIMDMLWPAIVGRGDPLKEDKHLGTPFEKYAYGRISENYKRIFEDLKNDLPLEYKRAQLLADMVSGMTDTYAVSFEAELRRYRDEK